MCLACSSKHLFYLLYCLSCMLHDVMMLQSINYSVTNTRNCLLKSTWKHTVTYFTLYPDYMMNETFQLFPIDLEGYVPTQALSFHPDFDLCFSATFSCVCLVCNREHLSDMKSQYLEMKATEKPLVIVFFSLMTKSFMQIFSYCIYSDQVIRHSYNAKKELP